MKEDDMKLEEKIYMKALTGMVLGGTALKNYQRVAVIGMEHILCSAASAALEASFMQASGGNIAHFLAQKGRVEEMVSDILEYDPEIVVMLYAETPEPGQNKELFLETMKVVAEKDMEADLLFDPVTLTNGALDEAVKNHEIQMHLMEKESFGFTIDLDNGRILMNVIDIENAEIMMDVIEEYKLTVEHAALLNRALRGKTLKWE